MNETTIVKTLKAGLKLIEKPENWLRYHFVGVKEGRAAYCALGAIRASLPPTGHYDVYDECREVLMRAIPSQSGARFVGIFNDHPTTKHKDIVKLYNRAIKLAESDGRLEALKKRR